jgi:hypothetical protein
VTLAYIGLAALSVLRMEETGSTCGCLPQIYRISSCGQPTPCELGQGLKIPYRKESTRCKVLHRASGFDGLFEYANCGQPKTAGVLGQGLKIPYRKESTRCKVLHRASGFDGLFEKAYAIYCGTRLGGCGVD